jgi:hypothetical protein
MNSYVPSLAEHNLALEVLREVLNQDDSELCHQVITGYESNTPVPIVDMIRVGELAHVTA